MNCLGKIADPRLAERSVGGVASTTTCGYHLGNLVHFVQSRWSLVMPHSIQKGLTAEHILLALTDLDAEIDHPFGRRPATKLSTRASDTRPRPSSGSPSGILAGRSCRPKQFSGGEAPGQANHVLRGLGFVVEKKGDSEEPESKAGTDWSADEVRLIVADYFDMLGLDLADRPFSKAEHNQTLRERLSDRSKGSVEFKHQNIGAVLLEMGLPYIDGYKPARNYQKRLLPQAIEDYLSAHPELQKELAASPVLNPTASPGLPAESVQTYFDEPPDRPAAPLGDSRPWLSRRGVKLDYAHRDAANRQLGRLGEQFSLELERRRLLEAGATTWLPGSSGSPKRAATAWASTSCRSTKPTMRSDTWRSRRPALGSTSPSW